MDKISHLLLTLPTSYDGVITALETLGEEHLNLAFVKTRLLDQEVKIKTATTTELKILHTSTRKFSRRPGFDKKSYYNTQPNKKSYPGISTHKISKLYCDHCGRRNHEIKDCIFYKRIKKCGNSDGSNQSNANTMMNDNNNTEDSFAFMFSNCKFLNSHTNSMTNYIYFLLDSGATDHIVNTKDYFSSYSEFNTPLKIGVAKNSTNVPAFGKGKINVTTNSGYQGTIENILYSPDVPYNLLSVNRIQEA
ncbi:jg3217, partial [Pararge aegeria aegeria]